MSNCGNCRLCNRFIISQSVTFTGGNLIINLPAGSYNDGCKYCIVVAQTIPATATINAPVFITIGTGTQLYPLNRRDCVQATACNVHTRTRYPVCVETSATSGVFRMLGRSCSCCDSHLRGINGTAPATAATAAED